MPIATVQKIKSWSFSRWQVYQECPAKAAYKFIKKLEEPGNQAMERGTIIHKMAEDFTNGKLKKLPEELKAFKAEFMALKKSGAITEENWGFTRAWEPCAWDDWQRCWLRVKMDCAYLDDDNWLNIIDHKTGKQKDDHDEQLSLYAVVGLIMFPDCRGVKAKLWYLDSGLDKEEVFERKRYSSLIKTWEGKVKAMMSDTKFAPRSGRYCSWCHYRKDNGGPCKF